MILGSPAGTRLSKEKGSPTTWMVLIPQIACRCGLLLSHPFDVCVDVGRGVDVGGWRLGVCLGVSKPVCVCVCVRLCVCVSACVRVCVHTRARAPI